MEGLERLLILGAVLPVILLQAQEILTMGKQQVLMEQVEGAA